jgi:ribonuclease P protein component
LLQLTAEAQARQDPRVSGASQHPFGPRDPEAPAAEGPQAADPLTLADQGRRDARPRRRLSRSGDFDRVYRDGSSRGNRFLVLYSFARGAEATGGEARLGVSVGRKVGGAVQRNKVKRAIRESFWKLAPELSGGHDYVIVARPGVEGLVDRDGAGGVEQSLAELVRDGEGDASGRERLS